MAKLKPGQRCCYTKTANNQEHVWYDDWDEAWESGPFKGFYTQGRCEYVEPPVTTGDRAAAWLRTVADNLVEKGKSYGDSVGNPLRIFSQAGVTEGIRVRIDDKLSRIARGKDWPGDDVVVDLVGYLALLAVTEQNK